MMRGAAALERQCLDEYLALHHEDILFHVFAPNELTGDYSGKDALRVLHESFKASVGGPRFQVDVHDTFASNAHGMWIIQYYPDRGNSANHDTVYVACQFHSGFISESWFVLWPKKLVTSQRSPDGH
jgi:hypothetical protein